MSWKLRFKAFKKGMKKYTGKMLSNREIGEITGNTRDSIQVVTSKEDKFPRWAKLAVWVYETMKND